MTTMTHNLFWGMGEADHRLEVSGRWPTDIDGAVFIVGPDKRRPGGHWFDAQGLLCKIHCAPDSDGRIRVQHKMIETPIKRLRDRMPSLFWKFWVLEISPFGFSNLANTNVQWIDDRLFIGYDMGRQIEVDPETLEYITPVGANDEWAHIMPAPLEPMTSVAAHPAPDFFEKQMYFVNYAQFPIPGSTNLTRLCRWDMQGAIEHWELQGMSKFDTIHDVKVSQNYLVVSDLPFVVEPGVFRGKPRKKAGQDFTQLWLVKKADLDRVKSGGKVNVKEIKIPMPTGHLAVDYDDNSDELTIYLQHIPASDLTIAVNRNERSHQSGGMFDPNFEGLISMGLQPTVTGRYRVNAKTGEILDHQIHHDDANLWGGALWTHNLSLPSSLKRTRNIFWSSMGWDPDLVPETLWRLYKDAGNTVFPISKLPKKPIPGAVMRIDLETMRSADIYSFGAGACAHPPTFVPKKNAKNDLDGYLLTIVHKNAPKQIAIFDAKNLSQGPLATATAPDFNPNLMLHSCYAPSRKGPRPSTYEIDLTRDVWGALKGFTPKQLGPVVKMMRAAATANRRAH